MNILPGMLKMETSSDAKLCFFARKGERGSVKGLLSKFYKES